MKKVQLASVALVFACGLGILSGCQAAPDEPNPASDERGSVGLAKQQVEKKDACAKEGESCKFSECCDGQCIAKGNDAAVCSGPVVCAAEGEVCSKLDCCTGACAPGDDGVSRCGPAPVKTVP